MMNNMNQYGKGPGANINEPLVIFPPPPPYPGPYSPPYRRTYPRPYPPDFVIPINKPCSGCRDRHDHRRNRFDYDRRRRGSGY